MAKSKRPQQTGGVPEAPQIQTNVNPVDTFVNPGLAGMPQQKEGTVAPNQPDMQKARDLQALGQAFQGLSQSLGAYGKSDKELDIAIEQWGAEQAALDKAMGTTAQTFSRAAENKWLPYIDHPGFQRGYSKAQATVFTSDLIDSAMLDYEKQIVSNPDFNTLEGAMKWFDGMIANAPRPKTSRGDVFEQTVVLTQSNGRKIFENKHRKYLNEKAVKDNTKALQTLTMQSVTAAKEFEPDLPVISKAGPMGLPMVTGITPLTPEEINERRVEEATKNLAAILDDEYGGLFTPALTKQIMGEALIDMAMGSDDPVLASFIKEVIENTPTGPKDSRVMLSDDPSVHPYYMTNQDRIDTQIKTGTNKAIKTAHENNILDFEQGVIDWVTDFHNSDPAGIANPKFVVQSFFQKFKDSNVFYNDETGYKEVKKGNVIEYYTEIDGQEQKVGSINVENAVQEATDRVIRNTVETNQKDFLAKTQSDLDRGLITPGDYERKVKHADMAALVFSAAELNTEIPGLSFAFSQAHNRVGNDVLLAGDIKDGTKEEIEKLYFGYDLLTSLDNHTLIKDLIPDEGTRDFFEYLKVIKTNEFVATHVTGTTGGTTWDDIWSGINKIKNSTTYDKSIVNNNWREVDGDKFVALQFEDDNYYNSYEVTQDVKKVARILHVLSGVPMKQAIQDAAESRKERLVNVGGFMIDKGEVHPALVRGGIPIGPDGELSSELWFDADTFGLAVDVPLGRAINAGENIPALMDALLDPENPVSQQVVKDTLGEMAVTMSRFRGSQTQQVISMDNVLDAVVNRLKTNPPKWFTARVPAADNEIVGLRMVEGSRGFAFEIATKSQDGILRVWRNENQKPFNLVDLVKLGKWKDKPIPGGASTFLFNTLTGTDKMVGGEMGGKLQGNYDKDGNWMYDLNYLHKRLQESSRHERGIPAGSDPTTTGYMQQ